MPRKTCSSSSSSSSRTNHYYDTMGTNVQRSSSITHSLIEQRGVHNSLCMPEGPWRPTRAVAAPRRANRPAPRVGVAVAGPKGLKVVVVWVEHRAHYGLQTNRLGVVNQRCKVRVSHSAQRVISAVARRGRRERGLCRVVATAPPNGIHLG